MNAAKNPFLALKSSLEKADLNLQDVAGQVEFFLESENVDGAIIDEVALGLQRVQQMTDQLLNSTSSPVLLESNSYILIQFDVKDDSFLPNVIALVAFIVLFRVATFLALQYQREIRK